MGPLKATQDPTFVKIVLFVTTECIYGVNLVAPVDFALTNKFRVLVRLAVNPLYQAIL